MVRKSVTKAIGKSTGESSSHPQEIPGDIAQKLARDAVALAKVGRRRLKPRRLKVRFSPPPPVEMNVKVRFVGSTGTHSEKLRDWPEGVKRRGIAALLEGVSAQDVDTLRELEPKLLKWIARSDENAARFYADPLGSLAAAGIDLDARLLKRIQRARRRSSQIRTQLPHARIKTIKPGL